MHNFIIRVLIMVIVMALVFSLAACGSTTYPLEKSQEIGKSEPIKLTLWHQWVDETDPSVNSLKKAITEWNNKNPDIQILATGVNGEQYKSKIKTALAAGEAPDLFYMWGGSFVYPYITEGNILALDSYLNDGTKDRILPGTLDSCTFNNKVYSLPMFTFIANLYCNKELFELSGAKIPENYDELLAAVKMLRAKGIVPIVAGEKDRWPGMYWFDILAMRQAGNAECLNALNNPSRFDQPVFKDAAAKLLELVRINAFNIDDFGTSFNDMLNEFINGRAAMMYQGNWVEASIEDNKAATKGKVTAVPFPVIKDGKGNITEFYGGGTDGFFINVNTKYKDEAVKVLKFISEKAGKEGYLNGAGLLCWKLDGMDETKLSPLVKQSEQLIHTGSSFINWWDTILPAQEAETHKELVAELFADKLTPEEFTKKMAQLKGSSQ